MDFIRIGDKVISKEKLWSKIEKILDLRVKGLSQQEAARRMSLDRTFISRLEGLGEVRKGHSIAVVGFPIKNKKELEFMLKKEGVEFSLIMSEAQRWAFVRENSGLDLFNKVMELTTKLQSFDCLIVLASNKRIKLFQGIFNNEVVGLEIGQSPIEEDKTVDIEEVQKLIRTLKGV
ncbi:MAG: transcriptional regulator [Bacillota bacterium]|nr:transcriptional regulator [Clostridia bacterium]